MARHSQLLTGALAREPELTYLENGTPRYSITLAGEDHITGVDGQAKTLPWYHRVTAFGKPAEWYAERNYATGDILTVDGTLQYSQTETPEGKRTYVNVRPENLYRLTNSANAELITDAGGGVRYRGGQNVTTIIGNVTRDVELRYTPAGDAVTNIGVAVNERWNDAQGNRQERVHYFEANLWRELAETNQHLKKGDLVLIQGRLINEGWTDREGNKRNSTRIEAFMLTQLERPAGNGERPSGAPQPTSAARPAAAARTAAPSRPAPTRAPARPPLDIDAGLDDFPPEEEDLPF